MSQEQPKKPIESDAVKYGDVFDVTGKLAGEVVAPGDAEMMQSAKASILGRTQRGGPAATMQAAAEQNERAGLVGNADVSDAAAGEGIKVSVTDFPNYRLVTKSVAGQVVGHHVDLDSTPVAHGSTTSSISTGHAPDQAQRCK